MPAPVPKDPLVREGRDAAIDAFMRGTEPARCPYRPSTKRALFWKHGAAQAEAALEQLMRIGA
ncbi:hypothetical protein [Novosphingobium sp. BL-52-GroH]|uniref:hypothetical protein n=1 Tax=Novosphingobium sp. BL-52-GroH TaxID=3349877 RepID=UPI00384E46F0